MIRTTAVYSSAATIGVSIVLIHLTSPHMPLDHTIAVLATLFIHSLCATGKTKKIPVEEQE